MKKNLNANKHAFFWSFLKNFKQSHALQYILLHWDCIIHILIKCTFA